MGQEKCLHTRDGNLSAGAHERNKNAPSRHAVTALCNSEKTLRWALNYKNCNQHRTAVLFAAVEETKTWHAAHSIQRRHAAQLCTSTL